MVAPTIDITIQRGKTFEYAFMYADDALVYKPIAALVSAAPARLSVVSHGIPSGWPVTVAGVKSPAELNTEDGEYRFATFVDSNTIEFNALDLTGTKAFSASGNVIYNQPVDLTGWTARATVRDRVGGTELLRWSSAPVAGDHPITVDTDLSAFIVKLDAATTAALTWTKGVWEMEAVDPDGKVYPVVAISKATVGAEVVI